MSTFSSCFPQGMGNSLFYRNQHHAPPHKESPRRALSPNDALRRAIRLRYALRLSCHLAQAPQVNTQFLTQREAEFDGP